MADSSLYRVAQLVTQSGNDTTTYSQLVLPDLDGKSGYKIMGMRGYWVDGSAVAAADWSIRATVQIGNTAEATPVDDEYIASVAWGMQNTAGVAVVAPYEPFKGYWLDKWGGRVTVSPGIYLAVASTSTGQANDVQLEVFYDIVKMTELEYMRLLVAGG